VPDEAVVTGWALLDALPGPLGVTPTRRGKVFDSHDLVTPNSGLCRI